MNWWTVIALILTLGCSRKAGSGDLPPLPASASSSNPGVCVGGGRAPTDPESVAVFPRLVAGYCLDPNGETRAYGAAAPHGLDGVCLEQFDGECEVYKSYGLDRLVMARYVDGSGGSGEVNVALSRFTSKEGAYGFFTIRLLGGADPALATSTPLSAGGAGALGSGVAYVWRGPYVAQLTYSNVDESPERLKTSANKILPELARSLGSRMSGELEPPTAVRLLPAEARLPLGVSFELKDLLGVTGTGPGAFGYHQEGQRRWRTLAIVKEDEASAKDTLKSFSRLAGARTEKGLPFEAMSFTLASDQQRAGTEWVMSRRGTFVLGLGDEQFVVGEGRSRTELEPRLLPRAEKLERLGRWLASLDSRTGGSGAGTAASVLQQVKPR